MIFIFICCRFEKYLINFIIRSVRFIVMLKAQTRKLWKVNVFLNSKTSGKNQSVPKKRSITFDVELTIFNSPIAIVYKSMILWKILLLIKKWNHKNTKLNKRKAFFMFLTLLINNESYAVSLHKNKYHLNYAWKKLR